MAKLGKGDCSLYVADRYGTVAHFDVSEYGWKEAIKRAKAHGDAAVGLRCPTPRKAFDVSMPMVKCKSGRCRVHAPDNHTANQYVLAGTRRRSRKRRGR